jgi:N-carbamoylputrescine amidase
MANVVRAAVVQTEWTGDKDSMIEKAVKYARDASAQGARVMCFQELFSSPYYQAHAGPGQGDGDGAGGSHL